MSLRLGLLLNQKMKQELKLTPQLQQAIRLLQLSRMDLIEEIQQELMSNPLLEERAVSDESKLDTRSEDIDQHDPHRGETQSNIDESADESLMRESQELHNEIDWAQYIEDESNRAPELGTQRLHDDHDHISPETHYSVGDSLQEHLSWQLQMSMLDERERIIAQQIIECINDKGYLRDTSLTDIIHTLNEESVKTWQKYLDDLDENKQALAQKELVYLSDEVFTLEEVAHHLEELNPKTSNLESVLMIIKEEVTVEEVEEILLEVQKFDPIGIAARNLTECLKIQAEFYQLSPLAYKIIDEHLKDLERKRFSHIARALSIQIERVYEITQEIQALDPRPGHKFSNELPRYVTPDVYVDYQDGIYKVRSNDEGVPRLYINSYYHGLLKDPKNMEAKQYVTQKLNAAHWLIRSLEQRKQTIVRVMESVLKFQYEFFEHGSEYLKPLILKQIADEVDLHESTISRATSGKYVYTPRGLFELKYFFNSGIQSTGAGEDLASQAVKIKIKKLIANEDSTRPLSDQKIVNLLREDGVDIARRTVAKYRESMGIFSSSQRKQHF